MDYESRIKQLEAENQELRAEAQHADNMREFERNQYNIALERIHSGLASSLADAIGMDLENIRIIVDNMPDDDVNKRRLTRRLDRVKEYLVEFADDCKFNPNAKWIW